jgi:cyclophilin-like protein
MSRTALQIVTEVLGIIPVVTGLIGASAAVLIVAPSWPNPIESQTVSAASAAPTRAQQAKTMKIRIDVDGTRVTATLDDNATSRDFISLLPPARDPQRAGRRVAGDLGGALGHVGIQRNPP